MKTPAEWSRKGVNYLSSSISNKIIIPYVLLTLLLAAFGTFVVTRLVAVKFEDRLKNQLIEAGRVVSDEIVNRESFRLEQQRAVANTIGVAEALTERNFDQLETLVSPIIANSKGLDSIVIVDTQGKEVLRLQRETLSPSAPVQPYKGSGADFFDWLAVSRVLSDPRSQTKEVQLASDPNSDQMIVYTVGPIRDSAGETVGAVLVGTYLQKELDLFHSLALADITLFDETGQVVATTFPLEQAEAEKVFAIFTPERYRQVVATRGVTLLDEIEGPQDVTTRGQAYRLAYGPYLLRGRVYGVYAVALPTNFITQTNDDSRNRLALVFSMGVVAVFGVGYLVSRRIIRPIIQLVQTSEAIAEGDLSRRSGLRSEDEIGTLARTFDNMTGELQRLLKIQQEEASKLNAILNSIADGVIVQDLEGEILVMNPAAEDILAVLDDDLAYAQLQQSQVDIELSTEGEITSRWLDSLTGLEFHESHRFEAGRRVLSALSAPVVINPSGEQLGSVVVLRDITREVESERLKDDFITSVSHELRTPLAAIKGYNDLLKMTGDSKLDEQQMQFIESIDQNVGDLLNLIQEMLDLSQIDAGELGIDQERVNLSELVQTESKLWQDKMSEKGLTFSTRLSPKTIWVKGDEHRLARVMQNLLKNAYDYTLPGGQVEVVLGQTDGRAEVAVKDTGVGISREHKRFLFTRFFRAIHEESTFEVSGAGLGLYMSKAIIEAHEGEIWVETEPGLGSTFGFTLPMTDPPDLVEIEEERLEYVETQD
jgi:PAS domain S-box-containing protein